MLAAAAVSAARPARADDDAAHVEATTDDDEAAPRLSLDPLFGSRFEGFGAAEQRQRDERRLPYGLRLRLESVLWSTEADLPLPSIDVEARGWRASARLERDLGSGWVLGVGGSLSALDSALARGRRLDLGLSVSKAWRLSRWTTVWLSLGLDHHRASGELVEADPNATSFMLRVGGTFR